MIPIVVGYDPRESIAYHVFCHSVLANTRARVQFIPISGAPRDGSNAFNIERFKAAEYAGYRGRIIYADSDMLLRPGADIEELYELAEPYYPVSVAQHNYRTRFPVKYWGKKNDDYPRKNWSSLMVINANHATWQRLDVDKTSAEELHRFKFIEDGGNQVGALPLKWNWLVGEYDFDPEVKLAHFTLGIPPLFDYGFDGLGYIAEWWDANDSMRHVCPT